jgi:peptidyl-prolyl cis-trans isomerase C
MICFRAYISLFIFVMGTIAPYMVLAQEDPVVAIVNKVKILRSELEDARMRLPDRLRNVPLQSVYGMLVNSLVNTKLVAAEARKINLQNDEEVRKRISRIEDQILERAFLESYIEKRITEKVLAEHYEKLIVANSSMEEIQARHILLEKKAQAYEIIKELEKVLILQNLQRNAPQVPLPPKVVIWVILLKGRWFLPFQKQLSH